MTDKVENQVEYKVTRANVENIFSLTLTDEEWEYLSNEIYGIFDHYLWSDLPEIVKDMPAELAEAAKNN
jgi:hypothetical protein